MNIMGFNKADIAKMIRVRLRINEIRIEQYKRIEANLPYTTLSEIEELQRLCNSIESEIVRVRSNTVYKKFIENMEDFIDKERINIKNDKWNLEVRDNLPVIQPSRRYVKG